ASGSPGAGVDERRYSSAIATSCRESAQEDSRCAAAASSTTSSPGRSATTEAQSSIASAVTAPGDRRNRSAPPEQRSRSGGPRNSGSGSASRTSASKSASSASGVSWSAGGGSCDPSAPTSTDSNTCSTLQSTADTLAGLWMNNDGGPRPASSNGLRRVRSVGM